MNYSETIDFLTTSLPMYHRIGQAAYKADITNTVQLMSHLGNPERKFRSIHVAGTNGKGSVSHMLCSCLMQAGYKVGLYTSPHLVDFRERIRINGAKIPEERVTRFVEQHKAYMQSLQLSFFEMTVGLAFDYFAEEAVDVAVIEVGMGGRLDSTNVITPDLCVITNIGFDHTQFLGDTLPKIAGEKAGIIKPGIPVVIGETHPETAPVFQSRAEVLGSPIYFADQHYRIHPQTAQTAQAPSPKPQAQACGLAAISLLFTVETNSKFKIQNSTSARPGVSESNSTFNIQHSTFTSPLAGTYQLKNLATLFQVLELLPTLGYRLTEDNIAAGIARTVQDTGLHGRWECIGTDPVTICETAHNADGIRAMLDKLAEIPYHHLHLVYGCVNDKDYRSILRMLPHENVTYYYTQPSVPRALPVADLVAAAQELSMPGTSYPNVKEAIEDARTSADPQHDLVLVTGSIFLIADALASLDH